MAEWADIRHSEVLALAMSVYLGERCKFCAKEFATLCDLDGAVWAGHHEHGRLAHASCWAIAKAEGRVDAP